MESFLSKLVTTTLSVESVDQTKEEAPRGSDCWRHQGVQTAGGTKGFSLKPDAVSISFTLLSK